MEAEMIVTEYSKVQIDQLQEVITQLGLGNSIAKRLLNDGLNCVITLNSGNFQSDSRYLRLRYHSIQDITKGDLESAFPEYRDSSRRSYESTVRSESWRICEGSWTWIWAWILIDFTREIYGLFFLLIGFTLGFSFLLIYVILVVLWARGEC
jgi:hypothetical protein